MYKEDYLLISGIQHYMFCPHQWGLIHIEDAWQENSLTYEGSTLHQKADNPAIKECRGSVFVSRSIPVSSDILKMQGVIDVIEFERNKNGIYIDSKKDWYFPRILEYKRGSPKEGWEDKVQLAALAMAFEEMRNIELDYGYLYYFSVNKRERVYFTEELRALVKRLAEEMHNYYDGGITPAPRKIKGCKSCSFFPTCSFRFGGRNAAKYIKAILEENEETS